MSDTHKLLALLRGIDGRQYPAYRGLRGHWSLGDVRVCVDHVQGDPYAAPSRVRVRVGTGIGAQVCADPVLRCAAEDWLLRRFGDRLVGESRGSGRSGELRVYRPGPEVLRRSALLLLSDGVAEVRMTVGLPARGRRVLGREAIALFTEDLPAAASRLADVNCDSGLAAHLASVRRQTELRAALAPAGLIAFIPDGALLPRRSGVDQRPLDGAVPFRVPAALALTLQTSTGPVVGMGIRPGITLITGGGFHGKSTVLHALQRAHLDHIPGDGREQVVAVSGCVKVRAEDGRSVRGVDIRAFLGDLPGGRPTARFDTDDASGSTSQAAAIAEALEAGASALLMDEDTCATNLMVRDARMQQLIPRRCEPITPLVARVRELFELHGVSTVFVVGGVGDYLGVAHQVIAMQDWQPRDVTAKARQIAGSVTPADTPMSPPTPRAPCSDGLHPTGKGRVRARDERRVDYGQEEIDLTAVEQVLDGAHAATIGHAIALIARELADGERTLDRLLDMLENALRSEGIDLLSPYDSPHGALVWPRRHEVAAAMNRLRTLRIAAR